jgi:tryptophanyl-tRNA synthetase
MITDPQRARKSDPGDPSVCNVFSFHKLYTDAGIVAAINEECRKAGIGCIECKKKLAASLAAGLTPIRERRSYYIERPELVDDIIAQGTARARLTAQQTMAEVRKAIGI